MIFDFVKKRIWKHLDIEKRKNTVCPTQFKDLFFSTILYSALYKSFLWKKEKNLGSIIFILPLFPKGKEMIYKDQEENLESFTCIAYYSRGKKQPSNSQSSDLKLNLKPC